MEAGMYQQQQVMILKSHGSGCALLENLRSRWDLILAQYNWYRMVPLVGKSGVTHNQNFIYYILL